jgi:hypothetical protein
VPAEADRCDCLFAYFKAAVHCAETADPELIVAEDSIFDRWWKT